MIRRLILLACVFVFAGLEYLVRLGWGWAPAERALWQQRWSVKLLSWLGFEVESRGSLPKGGSFIVPNHLSYMDIIVLASIAPQVFLSKSEVANWPIVGAYTRMAGTLFIDRKRKKDVANKEVAFGRVLEAGLNMTFFLEGTSSDGHAVLPFRSSLLEPVVAKRWPVTPAYIKYECIGGQVETDVCWWGDMGFVEHLLRMLKLERTRATIVFGEQRQPRSDRKAFAEELHGEVVSLSKTLDQAKLASR